MCFININVQQKPPETTAQEHKSELSLNQIKNIKSNICNEFSSVLAKAMLLAVARSSVTNSMITCNQDQYIMCNSH